MQLSGTQLLIVKSLVRALAKVIGEWAGNPEALAAPATRGGPPSSSHADPTDDIKEALAAVEQAKSGGVSPS